ncbi:(2Fe-2S)-binding protein [Pseudomonas gingeri]
MAHQTQIHNFILAGTGMFIPVGAVEATITIYFNDRAITARRGETLAACLLRAQISAFRTTPVTGSARLPYCMIGHCFDCLVEINGIGNQQACLQIVEEGMRVNIQEGAASIVGGL